MKKIATLTALSLVLAVTSVFAHHSRAYHYDESKPITLEGVVREISFVSPHASVILEVRNSKDELEVWTAVASAPRMLLQRGWTPASLKAGDRVVITGAPSRVEDRKALSISNIRRPSDGWTSRGD